VLFCLPCLGALLYSEWQPYNCISFVVFNVNDTEIQAITKNSLQSQKHKQQDEIFDQAA